MPQLEDMTNDEIWAELRRLKNREIYAFLHHTSELEQLREMIGEIEDEIVRRDR